jgi:hypothetical protein
MQLREARALLISAMSSHKLLVLGSIGLSPEWRLSDSIDDSGSAQIPVKRDASEPLQRIPTRTY